MSRAPDSAYAVLIKKKNYYTFQPRYLDVGDVTSRLSETAVCSAHEAHEK